MRKLRIRIKKNQGKKNRKKRGFTLVEVLLTIMIFAMVLTALLSCYIYGFSVLQRMKQMTIANQCIQKELELIRDMRFNDILSLGSSFTNEHLSYLENGNGLLSVEDSIGGEIKKLTVSVFWTFKGKQMRKDVVTYITKKGLNKK